MHKRIPFITFLLISFTGCDTPIGDLRFDQTDHNSEPIEFADSIDDTGIAREVNPTRSETEGARVFGNLPTILERLPKMTPGLLGKVTPLANR